MEIKHNWINTALIVAVLILVLVGGNNQSDSFGGTRFPNGISADNTSPIAGEVRGTTLTITGAATFQGAVALSSTLDVAGATIVDEFTQGGTVLSTSTESTSMVFVASDLLENSMWVITPLVGDLTYTFPASSTLSALVPSAGDSRTWTMVNASTTAGIDVIFAAGTGSAIKASGAGGLTLDEDSHGTIKLDRLPSSDITILVTFPDPD